MVVAIWLPAMLSMKVSPTLPRTVRGIVLLDWTAMTVLVSAVPGPAPFSYATKAAQFMCVLLDHPVVFLPSLVGKFLVSSDVSVMEANICILETIWELNTNTSPCHQETKLGSIDRNAQEILDKCKVDYPEIPTCAISGVLWDLGDTWDIQTYVGRDSCMAE